MAPTRDGCRGSGIHAVARTSNTSTGSLEYTFQFDIQQTVFCMHQGIAFPGMWKLETLKKRETGMGVYYAEGSGMRKNKLLLHITDNQP